MAKRLYTNGPTHKAVMAWMTANNIDLNLVRDYKLERGTDGSMWINVTMWYDDKAEEQEAV